MEKPEKYRVFNAWANTEAFLLGVVMIGAQIIILREFMIVLMPNELVIGLLLAQWLVYNGAGAWSGKYRATKEVSKHFITFLFMLVITIPIVSAFSISWFHAVFFEYGRMISLFETLAYSFFILFPVCFIGGFLFTTLNHSISTGKIEPHRLYAYESLGSLVGGGLVSLVFVYYQGADNFQSLLYLALFCFLFLGILHFRRRELLKSTSFLLFAIIVLLFTQFLDLSFIARQYLYPDQVLVRTDDSPYGSLDFTQVNNQQHVYENGNLIFSSDNITAREEDVHYGLLQRPESHNILLLGGGISGTVAEILKYKSVEKIDYVEVNPLLFELAYAAKVVVDYEYLRVNTISSDPIRYVKNTRKKYDVILINQAPPTNVQANRAYTVEFYQSLKDILHPGGIISTRLPGSENYLSDEELEIESIVFNCLETVYSNVLTIPGKKHYFIASDSSLNIHYASLYAKAEISNLFVNEHYLNDQLLQLHSEELQSIYLENVSLNHDFKPSVYLIYINQWLNYFGNRFSYIMWIVFVILLIVLSTAKPNTMAMFASGFTAASTEIVLLIAFQSLLGFLYLFLGLMITVFMGGLALGAFFSRHFKNVEQSRAILFIQFMSSLFILLLPVLLHSVSKFSSEPIIQLFFGVSIFIVAFFVGLQYGSIFNTRKGKKCATVPGIYSADLLGAGLGSFVTALWLVPVYGIYLSLFILAGLHFVVIGLVILKKKSSIFKG